MALPIDDLIATVTEDQALEKLLDILETLKLPARSWRVAGSLRTILRAVARTYSNFTLLASAAIKANWLDTASGDWLTRLAHYVYGVDRVPATFATGQLLLTNSGGGFYTYAVDALRAINPTTKKAYRNTEAFTLNPGDSLPIDFEAVEQGAASSATPGAINQLETSVIGVTVTNLAALVGQDEEEDEPLKQRCTDKLASLSPLGPRGAYRFAVLSATRDDGSPVDINRVQVTADPDTGIVHMYAASPSGTPTDADLGFARTSIENIARPDTVKAVLEGATTHLFAMGITVWATRTPGVAAADIQARVLTAIAQRMKTYPIGGITKPPSSQGYVYGDFLAGIIESAHPSIFDVDGADVDLELAPGEVASISVNANVRIVEAAPT